MRYSKYSDLDHKLREAIDRKRWSAVQKISLTLFNSLSKKVSKEKRAFFDEKQAKPMPSGEPAQTILITGGAGFIGSHLIEELLREGHSVVAIDNFNEVYEPYKKWQNVERFTGLPRFKLVVGDIRDTVALNRAFRLAYESGKGDFQVIHLAALAGVIQSIPKSEPIAPLNDKQAAGYSPADREYYEVNIMGTANVLVLSRRYGAKNIVAASSSSVYGGNENPPFKETDDTDRPLGPYAASKKMNEYQAWTYYLNHNIPITMLRYFTVYGIRGRPEMVFWSFFDNMRKGLPIKQRGPDTSTRSYTHISDVTRGMIACTREKYIRENFYKKKKRYLLAERKGTKVSLDDRDAVEVLNIGGSQTVELGYLRKLMAKNLGVKPEVDMQKPNPAEVPVSSAITCKAEHLIGYKARMTIERGVEEYGRWYHIQERYQPVYDRYRNLRDKMKGKRGRVSANDLKKAIDVAEQLKRLLIELDPDKIKVDKSEYLVAYNYLAETYGLIQKIAW